MCQEKLKKRVGKKGRAVSECRVGEMKRLRKRKV